MRQRMCTDKSERRFDIAKSLNILALAVMCVVVVLGISGCDAKGTPDMKPTIDSLNPASGRLGQTFTVTIRGSNFVRDATSVQVGGTGVTTSDIDGVQASNGILFVTFTIDNATPTVGAHTVTISTPNGGSNVVTFTVTTGGTG